jgi:predicted RNA methylase
MMDLIPRATVAQICGHRRQALARFAEAYDAIQAANGLLGEAWGAVRAAAPVAKQLHFSGHEEIKALCAAQLPERDAYLANARMHIDREVWTYVVEATDLNALMDKKAKDELRQQLLRDPPEATEENILATFTGMVGQADHIFRRGIAECFSALDRRFRSHDGWKIGSRVILTRAFDGWGSWNYHQNHRDTLTDIERVFFVLDGKTPPPNYAGIVGAVDESRKGGGLRGRQSLAESDFFRVRCFENGNAHVWFKRDDLVAEANKLLGEFYGEVIPEDREPDKDSGLNDPKTSLAKNYGFFATPDKLADQVIDGAALYSPDRRLTVLEPSAGTGQLAERAAAKGCLVDCIEVHPDRARGLVESRRYRSVIQADFLLLKPGVELYDRIIMNPPFDRERDIDHVMHALKFLKPDGFLVAIMSAGTEFRETRKSKAFRDLMGRMKAVWRDLPANSFASVGTNVNTILLRVWNDSRRFY